jgi:hypothetical protein
LPEVTKILPNYLNYAVAVLKGWKFTWSKRTYGTTYHIWNAEGREIMHLDNGHPSYNYDLQGALKELDNYATDLTQAWKLLVELPYNVRAEILKQHWDTDNPADMAYSITAIWIITMNKRNPFDAIHGWWDMIATFVPRADSEFGEEYKPNGNSNL